MNPKCGSCGASPLQIKLETVDAQAPAGQPIMVLGIFCCIACGSVFNVTPMGMKPPTISLGGTIPTPNQLIP